MLSGPHHPGLPAQEHGRPERCRQCDPSVTFAANHPRADLGGTPRRAGTVPNQRAVFSSVAITSLRLRNLWIRGALGAGAPFTCRQREEPG